MSDNSYGKKSIALADLHWTVHRWSIFWVLMVFPMLAGGPDGAKSIPGALMIAGFIFVKNLLKQKNSSLQVLENKIVLTKGILSKALTELPLEKFEAVHTHQSFLGRALNYGTVATTGTGGVRLTLDRVAAPILFKDKPQNYIDSGKSTG